MHRIFRRRHQDSPGTDQSSSAGEEREPKAIDWGKVFGRVAVAVGGRYIVRLGVRGIVRRTGPDARTSGRTSRRTAPDDGPCRRTLHEKQRINVPRAYRLRVHPRDALDEAGRRETDHGHGVPAASLDPSLALSVCAYHCHIPSLLPRWHQEQQTRLNPAVTTRILVTF